jgi:hypothetical protein
VGSLQSRLCKLQKGGTQLAATSDKDYQLRAHGRWFYPGTPTSSTTKTGRHDIAEILLKVAFNTINQIKSIIVCILLLAFIIEQ